MYEVTRHKIVYYMKQGPLNAYDIFLYINYEINSDQIYTIFFSHISTKRNTIHMHSITTAIAVASQFVYIGIFTKNRKLTSMEIQ